MTATIRFAGPARYLILFAAAVMAAFPAGLYGEAAIPPCPGFDCTACSPSAESAYCVDHKNPKSPFLCLAGKKRAFSSKGIENRIGKKTPTLVFNTDTALFDYVIKTEDIDLKTLADLQKFTAALAPYAIFSVLQAAGPLEDPRDVGVGVESVDPQPACRVTEAQLGNVYDSLTRASDRLEDANDLQIEISEALKNINGAQAAVSQAIFESEIGLLERDIEERKKPLSKYFDGKDFKPYRRLLKAYLVITDKHPQLTEELERLARAPSIDERLVRIARTISRLISEAQRVPQECGPELQFLSEARQRLNELQEMAKIARKTEEEAKKALEDRPKNLSAAVAAEAFAWNLIAACSVWEADDPFKVSWDKGKKVTVTATRKKHQLLARTKPTLKPFSQAAKILPDRLFRPAVGLALLYIDENEFPEYGTKKRDDGSFDIVVKDVEDERAFLGLALSTTWRGLDHRRDKNWAFWVPEIFVRPSDSDLSFGTGIGFSWKQLKISAGVMWTKHKELADGLALADILASEDDFATRDSFGSAEVYVGISVVGWSPFKN